MTSYIKKLFTSYVLILIPCYIAFTALASGVFVLLREDNLSIMQSQAHSIRNKFELQYQTYELSSMNISLNKDVTTQMLTPTRTSSIRCVQTLQSIKNYDPMTHDVFITMNGSDIYASGGMSSMDTYVRSILRISDPDQADALSQLIRDTQGSAMRFFSSAEEKLLLFHYSVPANRGYERVSVNFLVGDASLIQLMNEMRQGLDSYVGIILPNGQSIVFHEERNGSIAMVPDMTIREMPGAKQRHTMLTSYSEHFQVGFALSSSTALLFGDILLMQIGSYIFIALILFAALLMSYRFSKRNAYPIQQIVKALGVNNKVANENKGHAGGDLSYIRDMIALTAEENARMSAVVENARRTIAEQNLLLLFHGLPDGRAGQAALVDAETSEGWRCVVLICLHGVSNLQPAQIDACYDKLKELPGCRMNCREMISDRPVLTVLYNLPDQDAQKISRHAFGRRIVEVSMLFDLATPFLCFSRAFEGYEDIGKAHVEAVYAFNARPGKSWGDAPLLFDELVAFDLSAALTKEESNRFREALLSRDRASIDRQFAHMMEKNEREGRGEAARITFRYEVLNSTLHCLMDMNGRSAVLTEILRSDPFEQNVYRRNMNLLFEAICRDAPALPADSFAVVIDYIRRHYKEPGLSLKSVAEHSNLSTAYVSRLFRIKTGKRYIDHVTEIRMKEALRLLSGTGMGLQEIVWDIGYSDMASFHKKFTAMYGLTPMKYRELNKKTCKT